MDGLTCERDSRGNREQRVCLFLLWASRSTNITDHEHPCRAKKTHTQTSFEAQLNHATCTGTTTKTASQKRHLTVKWLKQLKAHRRTSEHTTSQEIQDDIFGLHMFLKYTTWECLNNSESKVILSLEKSPSKNTKCW